MIWLPITNTVPSHWFGYKSINYQIKCQLIIDSVTSYWLITNLFIYLLPVQSLINWLPIWQPVGLLINWLSIEIVNLTLINQLPIQLLATE